MSDTTNHLDALVTELRQRMKEIDSAAATPAVAKATPTREELRQRNSEVMAKAISLQGEGKITALDVIRLHALRLQLDAALDEG